MYPSINTQKKPPFNAGSSILLVLYYILLGITVVLVLFLGGMTIYALGFRNPGSRPWYTIPAAPIAPLSVQEPERSAAEDGMFTGIGRLRMFTADDPPVTVVVSLAFPYPAEDWAFIEELASKVSNFRNIAIAYFSAYKAEALRQEHEEAIKAEILRRYNNILQLGNINTLYFNDFMLIE